MEAIRLPAAVLSVALVLAGCDRVEPPPPAVRYINLALPAGVSDYHEHESGWQGAILQVRFDLPVERVPALQAGLPCRLGPLVEGAPPAHHAASVGTNDRRWYRPETATRHRSCRQPGRISSGVLVDLSRAVRATVYLRVNLP